MNYITMSNKMMQSERSDSTQEAKTLYEPTITIYRNSILCEWVWYKRVEDVEGYLSISPRRWCGKWKLIHTNVKTLVGFRSQHLLFHECFFFEMVNILFKKGKHKTQNYTGARRPKTKSTDKPLQHSILVPHDGIHVISMKSLTTYSPNSILG